MLLVPSLRDAHNRAEPGRAAPRGRPYGPWENRSLGTFGNHVEVDGRQLGHEQGGGREGGERRDLRARRDRRASGSVTDQAGEGERRERDHDADRGNDRDDEIGIPGKIVVPLEGLEPTTPSLRMMCSTS